MIKAASLCVKNSSPLLLSEYPGEYANHHKTTMYSMTCIVYLLQRDYYIIQTTFSCWYTNISFETLRMKNIALKLAIKTCSCPNYIVGSMFLRMFNILEYLQKEPWTIFRGSSLQNKIICHMSNFGVEEAN